MSKIHETPEEVMDLVKPLIDEHQPETYRFIVKQAWFSKGFDAWVVGVDVDREEVSVTDYARRLADIEEIIEHRTGKRIVLTPALYLED